MANKDFQKIRYVSGL